VIVQVFQHLDSRTLCTTIPLICQQWRAIAASEQLWAKRCDLQLLSALQKHHALHTSTYPQTSEPYSNKSDSRAACAQPGTTCGEALTPLCSTQYVVRLPLLHHAVYSCNLLRNPLFLAAANTDQSMLQRWRPSSAGSSWKAQAVLTDKQRKFAWVGIGCLRWFLWAMLYVCADICKSSHSHICCVRALSASLQPCSRGQGNQHRPCSSRKSYTLTMILLRLYDCKVVGLCFPCVCSGQHSRLPIMGAAASRISITIHAAAPTAPALSL